MVVSTGWRSQQQPRLSKSSKHEIASTVSPGKDSGIENKKEELFSIPTPSVQNKPIYKEDKHTIITKTAVPGYNAVVISNKTIAGEGASDPIEPPAIEEEDKEMQPIGDATHIDNGHSEHVDNNYSEQNFLYKVAYSFSSMYDKYIKMTSLNEKPITDVASNSIQESSIVRDIDNKGEDSYQTEKELMDQYLYLTDNEDD